MCKYFIITRIHDTCPRSPKHTSKTTEFPINERCDHPYAGTTSCPNLATSHTILGSTPVTGPCPIC
ncbi:hypothetical protein F5Y08DRAFT_313631 [Xylaria arbuscula]|nr:hypothetical protein F5Y08DRAFT_313631 [Xylaria arbuscula]